jgi:hypothetical protein
LSPFLSLKLIERLFGLKTALSTLSVFTSPMNSEYVTFFSFLFPPMSWELAR